MPAGVELCFCLLEIPECPVVSTEPHGVLLLADHVQVRMGRFGSL